MANPAFLSSIVANLTAPSWEVNCITLLNSSAFDWTHGLVNGKGQPVSALTSEAWGIDSATCHQYCSASAIPFAQDFNFADFSGSLTNFFLPWLALTAQLPFETGDPWINVMSFCLAVGSPTLVTYSLAITILNRFWVRRVFGDLRVKARGPGVRQKLADYDERINAAQYLLQEAQQVPLRASQENGWLSSLIVTPKNEVWWHRLEDRLKGTRRGFTASLVAQMFLAFIAYLFTVITSFKADLGDITTALQIASGSLWIWLIPVILGWITVGTQYKHSSIEHALTAEAARRANLRPIQANDFSRKEQQKALVVRSGLTPQPHRVQTAPGAFDTPDMESLTIPTWYGADVSGDERLKGPIFNYAKLLTWWQLASTVEHAMQQTVDNISKGMVCDSFHRRGAQWDEEHPQENLVADSLCTAIYCGLDSFPIFAYPSWERIPSALYRRVIAAAFIALFVQWGTTGASIVIAYNTPTVGLGCRSASYVFYGGLGTVVWLCLLASMFLSHEVMLRYQDQHINNTSMDFHLPYDPNNPNRYKRTWLHSALCAAAVILRYTGKFLAVINTMWLILSSLLEFIGAYDNCWCKADAFSLGQKGWIVLFKDDGDLANAASLFWGGGLAMTLLVCIVSYVFFLLGSSNDD